MDANQLERAISSTIRCQEVAHKEMFLPEALQGNENTLWQTYMGGVQTLSRVWAFSDTVKPIHLLEAEIRSQWRLFVLAAEHTDAHHPAQDRLTRLILWTREMGLLTRSLNGPDGEVVVEEAVTTTGQGRIWVDMPFMLPDMQDAWKEAVLSVSSSSSAEQCHNLTAAVARLAGVGLLDDAFSGCGLDVMRQTLEMPFGSADVALPAAREALEEHVGLDATRAADSGLAMLFLLRLVRLWLYYAGWKLLRLSTANHVRDHSAWNTGFATIGPLARSAGIHTGGFSEARFKFWKDRLAVLKETQLEDGAVKEAAAPCSWLIDGVWNNYYGVRDSRLAGKD